MPFLGASERFHRELRSLRRMVFFSAGFRDPRRARAVTLPREEVQDA